MIGRAPIKVEILIVYLLTWVIDARRCVLSGSSSLLHHFWLYLQLIAVLDQERNLGRESRVIDEVKLL